MLHQLSEMTQTQLDEINTKTALITEAIKSAKTKQDLISVGLTLANLNYEMISVIDSAFELRLETLDSKENTEVN